MAKHSRPPKPKRQTISLAVQDLHVRQRFPRFVCHIVQGLAVWKGTLQPRVTSPIYHVEIRYKSRQIPTVRVRKPPLAPHSPHLYRDGTLCLYWPKEWWWQSDELIAQTIIPWTAAWLYYYEIWLDTGQWLGPSSHDSPK